MPTVIRDLMSTPPVQAGGDDTLASVARRMADANIGSVIIADGGDVVGIVTERDLLRAAAVDRDPATEPARRWMTPSPDVLGPEEEAEVAWSSLSDHHYRHLPVMSGGDLVGVVSLRDLDEHRPAPPGGRDERGGAPRARRGGRGRDRRR